MGQANGELAKQVLELLGKTLQGRESISINSSDTSTTRSKQLENAVPVIPSQAFQQVSLLVWSLTIRMN